MKRMISMWTDEHRICWALHYMGFRITGDMLAIPKRLRERQSYKIHYSSVDGVKKTHTFDTLVAAQKFAWDMVGETPEIGSRYAISGDGIGKVTVEGTTLKAMFPKCDWSY